MQETLRINVLCGTLMFQMEAHIQKASGCFSTPQMTYCVKQHLSGVFPRSCCLKGGHFQARVRYSNPLKRRAAAGLPPPVCPFSSRPFCSFPSFLLLTVYFHLPLPPLPWWPHLPLSLWLLVHGPCHMSGVFHLAQSLQHLPDCLCLMDSGRHFSYSVVWTQDHGY